MQFKFTISPGNSYYLNEIHNIVTEKDPDNNFPSYVKENDEIQNGMHLMGILIKNINSGLKFHYLRKYLHKMILVLTVFIILTIPGMALNVSIDTNKYIVLNGTNTFITGFYEICNNFFESPGYTESCYTSINRNTGAKWTLSDWNSNKDSTFGIPDKLDSAGIYFTINANGGNTNNSTIRNMSHFGGYNQADEATNETEVKNTYNFIKSKDTNHPITLNHWINMTQWKNYTDIISWDYYPVRNSSYFGREDAIYAYEHYSNSNFFKGTNPDNISNPVWAVIQANGLPEGDRYVPTEVEARGMTYSALTMNVKGIQYWSYKGWGGAYPPDAKFPNATSGLYNNLTLHSYYIQLMKELNSFNEWLVLPTYAYSWHYFSQNGGTISFSNNPMKKILWETRKSFNYLLKNDTNNNTYYLIIQNKNNISITTNITISGLTGTMIATTLGLETSGSAAANNSHEITNGVFSDTFDGFASHVYKISVKNSYPRYDIDENGKVDMNDLTLIGQHFNEAVSVPYPRHDVNMNGMVNIEDITITGQNFDENT